KLRVAIGGWRVVECGDLLATHVPYEPVCARGNWNARSALTLAGVGADDLPVSIEDVQRDFLLRGVLQVVVDDDAIGRIAPRVEEHFPGGALCRLFWTVGDRHWTSHLVVRDAR